MSEATAHNNTELAINAEPTKALFVSMLIRDVDLREAILDLVDNCVDGARRVNPESEGRFDGLYARLEVNSQHLRISDNCGGMSVADARNYAFRFGRDWDTPHFSHSIGEFGIGMKRAFFKIGTGFRVESRTATERFVVDEQDIYQWMRRPGWHFFLSELQQGVPVEQGQECGVTIEILPLHPEVATSFSPPSLVVFENRLAQDLASKHQDSIARGLSISVNGIPVEIRPSELLQSDLLQPSFYEDQLHLAGNTSVLMRIHVGIGDSSPQSAGWYVFCNGRLVVAADQTNLTGWGESGETRVPQHHNQFSRFRGYVFFDSNDAGAVPWNTAKTGVDADSAVFRNARRQMIRMMRPVIDFLNDLDREKDTESSTLEETVAAAQPVSVGKATRSDRFVAPRPEAGPKMGRIQYSRPYPVIDQLREALGDSRLSLTRLGEMTFDYVFEMEIRPNGE